MNLSKYVTGGNFVIEDMISGRFLNTGAGILLSVPEVAGKVYKIINLAATSNTLDSIRLTIDGVILANCDEITKADFNQPPSSTAFGVSRVFGGNNSLGHSRLFREIYCKSFELRLLSSTANVGYDYCYQIGSFK